MSSKNFGPAVSGYLDPTGRNWETAVYQAGKPVLDKELNLAQDLDNGSAQAVLRRGLPSGWLSDDFLATSNATQAIFSTLATADTLEIPNGLVAHVNGWLVQVQETNVTGSNQLDLGAGPAGNGTRRTDIVILEVWRRLVSASPSADGKSATGRIWQNGNVKTDPANDLTLNYVDDILDTNVGSESTKRVQIQYRLRSIQGIDVFAYPYGMDDPSLVANSVPATPGAPDGVATVFQYLNQSFAGDQGLWIAGDGNPANTLGTVDGFMYAIPLMAVFRRNTTAFDRRLNQNGGVAFPGPSDRPDGLFSDIFNNRDILDLRLGVQPNGWSYPELLEKNFNLLLDNQLYTEVMTTSPFGGGCEGATVFVADEIGISNGHGGDGLTTGTTGVGQFLGEFDAVRRRFSDRSTYEVVSVQIPAPFGGWADGSVVTVDPTALPVYPYSAFNWASYNPAEVVFQDVVAANWVGAPGGCTLDASTFISSITDLGAVPVVSLTVTFDNNVTGVAVGTYGLSNEPLFLDIIVAYPPDGGLSKTPTSEYGSDSFYLNNPGQLPASAPVYFSGFVNQFIDAPHREVQLEYETVDITITQAAAPDTNLATFRLPERANSITTVLRNAAPLVGSTNLDASGRIVTFTSASDYTSAGDDLTITYKAIRPLPQNGEQMTIYYEVRAPQTARSSLLGTDIQVIPKHVSPYLYALTCGSGSQDEGYPFPYSYVQTGGIYKTSILTYGGESELSARADIAVADFNASTGFLRLPVYIPVASAPDDMFFLRSPADVDVEGRSFFPSPDSIYIPNAYAQDLSDPKVHKDVLPMICELAVDSPLGFKGQLVLMLLLRYGLFDETNGVFFNADLTQNTTVASVFRLKGNLLNKRAV